MIRSIDETYDVRTIDVPDGSLMATVTVSPKFQVVIPKAIREELGLTPGQKVAALALDGRIELVPLRDVRELRGLAAGIDTTVARETDR